MEQEIFANLAMELTRVTIEVFLLDDTIPAVKKQEWMLTLMETYNKFGDVLIGHKDTVIDIEPTTYDPAPPTTTEND